MSLNYISTIYDVHTRDVLYKTSINIFMLFGGLVPTAYNNAFLVP